MVAASNPVELKGTRVSVALNVEPAARPRLGRPAGMGLDDAESEPIYLNVEDIDAPHNPGLVYGVYVNAPQGATPDERQQYHVGNVSLFGIEAVKDPDRTHAVPGLKHTFNISHVVSRLKAANRWNPATIDVTFEPVVPVQRPAPGMGIAEDMPQLRDAASTPIRIGRISLFVG